MALELTVRPEAGAGGGNTTVDGDVSRFSGTVWDDLREGAGDGSDATDTNAFACGVNTPPGPSGDWSVMTRSIFTLDTSALTSGATISDAVWSVYPDVKRDDFSASIALVDSSPTANNALENADYNTYDGSGTGVGTTLYAAARTITGISTGSLQDWPMNPIGIAAISKTGITKLGMRLEADRTDTEPVWAGNDRSSINVFFADVGTEALRPVLVITYTMGGVVHEVTFAITAVADVSFQRTPTKALPITAVAVTGFTRKVSRTLSTIATSVVGLSRTASKVLPVISKAVVGFTRQPSKALSTIAVAVVGFASSKVISRTFAVVAVAQVGFTRKVSKPLATIAVNVVGFARKTSKTFDTIAIGAVGFSRKTSKTLSTTAIATVGFTRKAAKTLATTAVAVVGFASTKVVSMTFAIVAVANVGFSRKVSKTLPIVAVAVVGLGKRISKTWAVIVKAVVDFSGRNLLAAPTWLLNAKLKSYYTGATDYNAEFTGAINYDAHPEPIVHYDSVPD